MRLRSLSSISLLVIVASFGVLAGVPAVRQGLLAAAHSDSLLVDFVAQAQRHPEDPDALLAALGCHHPWYTSAADLAPIYERAVALLPGNAAPHVLYAGRTLREVPLSRAETDASVRDELPDHRPTGERPLSASERKALGRTQQALERAAKLDPENAAIDYLRAYLAVADHRDHLAFELLRTALTKRTWNLYEREGARAAFHVSRALLPPLEASLAVSAAVVPPESRFVLPHFTRTITGMAVLAQEAGDVSQAIFLRESMMHLCRLILAQGYSVADGLLGVIMWSTVTELDLSEAETRKVESLVNPGRYLGTPGQLQAARNRALKEAGRLKFAEYLRKHGRADLAEEVLSFSKAVDKFTWGHGRNHDMLALSVLTAGLGQAGVAMVAALVGLLVCGGAGLLLQLAGRPAQPIRYPPWARFLLLSVSLVLVLIEGFLRLAYAREFVILGLPLIWFVVLVVVVAHRYAHRAEQQVGLVRHYMGTLLALMLPLAAMLCLIAVSFAIPTALHRSRLATVNRAVIYQGELTYYGLAVR